MGAPLGDSKKMVRHRLSWRKSIYIVTTSQKQVEGTWSIIQLSLRNICDIRNLLDGIVKGCAILYIGDAEDWNNFQHDLLRLYDATGIGNMDLKINGSKNKDLGFDKNIGINDWHKWQKIH